ncbi:MAG: HD domain-containing protein [Pseudobdellovibrionaceae bacterium]
MGSSLVQKAREFAIRAHGNQKYGKDPYKVHLEQVVEVMNRFQYGGDPELVACAWLHDVVEDTEVSLEQVEALFGARVKDIVCRLTDEPGSTRRDRKLKTYPKVKGHRDATIIKLCDRIANIEASFYLLEKFMMYRSEYPEFRENLYVSGMAEGLWSYLEYLYVKALREGDEKPKGFVQPLVSELQKSYKALEKKNLEEAKLYLAKASPQNFEERMWAGYLKGLVYFFEKQNEHGYKECEQVYKEILKSDDKLSPSAFRLLAACLKKMGWYHRLQKSPEKAYAMHSIQAQYLEKYGSFVELHDVQISLDVDAYQMADYRLSEAHLRKSLECAERIESYDLQTKSLAVSCNNLAGTLVILKKFEEAESYVLKSLEFWQTYEKEHSPEVAPEFRVVWALFAIGDIYESWAKHIKEQSYDFSHKATKTREYYQRALDLGKKQNLPEGDFETISRRLSNFSL